MTQKIFIRGMAVLVSDIDYERCMQYSWHVNEHNGSMKPYVCTTITTAEGKRTSLYMHRLITDCPPEYRVDHWDRDTLNNQRPNLRVTGFYYNNTNREGWSLSGFKGVSRDGAKFRARITVDSVVRSIGRYDKAEDAARAYDAAAWEQWGEFAYLNFPEDFTFPVVDFPEPEDIPF